MPKLLVMFQADDSAASALADAAAEGARGVRFMEVDVRSLGADFGRVKAIASTGDARDYDGLLLACSSAPGAAAIEAFVSELGASGDTKNMVFAAAGDRSETVLARCREQGGLVVSLRPTGNADADANALGARAGKVVGWVRHALGHEAEHQAHSHHHHQH